MSDVPPQPQPQTDRRAVMFRNVRTNVLAQSSDEHRENYLRSCEAHGGDIAEVVAVVRAELVKA